MALAFYCPQCRQPLPVSPGMLGQKVQCASCQASFVLSPAHLQAPEGTGAVSAAASAPTQNPSSPMPSNPSAYPPGKGPATATRSPSTSPASAAAMGAAPAAIAEPPRPLPATVVGSPAPTARVNASNQTVIAPSTTTLKPTPDGKLPTLALYSEATRSEKNSTNSGPSTLVVLATLAVSVTLSLTMLLFDFSPTTSPTGEAEAARAHIVKFYGDDPSALLPYQKTLRESQRAHSRGDRKSERQCYREVLELLRSENRDVRKTLTGSLGDDRALENDLTALLRSTAETSFLE